jgi:multicomponent Na+:H+ antiporter subunit B
MSAHRPVIVRAASKFAIPLLFVFAAHLAVDGAGAPGGGFAAAGAFAAGVLLFGLLFGIDAARRAVPTIALRLGAALGIVLLLGVGVAGFVRGYGFLDFRALAQPGPATMRLGATLIEAGVALAASCSFILAFFAIAGRAAEISDGEW